MQVLKPLLLPQREPGEVVGEALRGAAGSVSPEFAKKDGKCDERMEKYKIAIMGASGVGRTVFLCSYFNMAFSAAVKRKRQRRPISVKSQDDGIVDKFFTFLFKKFVDRKSVV